MAATHQAKVQVPKDIVQAGHKLLKKMADRNIKLGGHALAARIDSAGIIRLYASLATTAKAVRSAAAVAFAEQCAADCSRLSRL